jgi:hypothetical protein
MATADTGQAPSPADKCDPNCPDTPPGPGPVREAGGTTGAGNLSPARASRTAGASRRGAAECLTDRIPGFSYVAILRRRVVSSPADGG